MFEENNFSFSTDETIAYCILPVHCMWSTCSQNWNQHIILWCLMRITYAIFSTLRLVHDLNNSWLLFVHKFKVIIHNSSTPTLCWRVCTLAMISWILKLHTTHQFSLARWVIRTFSNMKCLPWSREWINQIPQMGLISNYNISFTYTLMYMLSKHLSCSSTVSCLPQHIFHRPKHHRRFQSNQKLLGVGSWLLNILQSWKTSNNQYSSVMEAQLSRHSISKYLTVTASSRSSDISLHIQSLLYCGH